MSTVHLPGPRSGAQDREAPAESRSIRFRLLGIRDPLGDEVGKRSLLQRLRDLPVVHSDQPPAGSRIEADDAAAEIVAEEQEAGQLGGGERELTG